VSAGSPCRGGRRPQKEEGVPEVDLKKIQPNKMNPRLKFSKSGLDDLASSITQFGVLEPILVRPVNGHYQVVVGERRYRAAQQAGLDSVPVVIRDYSDEEVMEINLVENVQREDLSAVEKARLCDEMRSRWPERYATWESIARRIGVEPATVRTWVRTLGLPEEVQERIAPREKQRVPEGKIDYQTALRVAEQIPEPERQAAVVEQIVEERLPQRVAAEVIRRVAAEPHGEVKQMVEQAVRETQPIMSFNHRHYKAVVAGQKTQTTRRRLDPGLKEGVTVRAAVTHFADLEIEHIDRKRLRDITAEDADREGGYTLEQFKERWVRVYGDWTPDDQVYVVQFKVQRLR
jgi:ParB family transcriptional regulator, chromosome partitioning protein